MRLHNRVTLIPAIAFAVTIAGCSRTDQAAKSDQAPASAEQNAERQRYISQMDQRLSSLEHKLSEMKDRPAPRAVKPERIEELQDEIKELRSEVAELRTAGTDNWWPNIRRSVERSTSAIESDLDRETGGGTASRARTDRPEPAAVQGTDADREQFVNRMEAEVRDLDRQLSDLAKASNKDAAGAVEDVREELDDLKRDISDLRNVNEQNWWDVSRQRVDRAADRIEQAINRMTGENQ